MNQHEIAASVAAGDLPSPQRLGASALFAVRITGTGVAYRQQHAEHVFRPPENYLTPEFRLRCNGLPVMVGHPASGKLDSAEYAQRTVDAITLPYLANGDGIQDDDGAEVWGIARICDDAAIRLLATEPASTSPSVIFHSTDGNETFDRADGSSLLIEGVPSRLDHLAILICEAGVWDKGGKASGVRNDVNSQSNEIGKTKMASENNGDDKLDKMLTLMDSLATRMDAMEGKVKADLAGDPDKVDLSPRRRLGRQARARG